MEHRWTRFLPLLLVLPTLLMAPAARAADGANLLLARELLMGGELETARLECRRLLTAEPGSARGRSLLAGIEAIGVSADPSPRRSLLADGFIGLYRVGVRPALGSRCALHPSCSAYSHQALNEHGLLGFPLMVDRLIREPAVIAGGQRPVRVGDRLLLADSLEDHDGWLRRGESRSAAEPIPELPPESEAASPEILWTSPELASRLAAEGQHLLSALELRRLALAVPAGPERDAYSLAAASEYLRADRTDLAGALLDRIDPADRGLRPALGILRAEAALRRGDPQAALPLLAELAAEPGGDERPRFARRRLAALLADRGELVEARNLLSAEPGAEAAGIAALEELGARPRKRPMVGGLLGVVPGMGYAYSGEIRSAVTSLLLNSVCIWGMVEMADQESWGAFTGIGLVELTLWSGSIVGGIDAAHRTNRERARECREAILDGAEPRVELDRLPGVVLRFYPSW